MKTHEIYKALELRGFPGGLSQNEMTRLIDAVRSCIDKALREATHPQATEPAPSTAGERDNKTEMLAKLTAWLDGLGGSIHTYSLRGIALDGFEKGWDASRSQPTTEESLLVAGAQPVREPLTPDTHYQEWKHGCDSMCTNITLWIDRCPHCGKPRPVVEAAHGITKKGEQ